MRRYLPIVIALFVASLAWLGFASYARYVEASWDGTMPDGMDFIGTWQIESRTTDGHELSGDNLKKVKDYGFDSFVVLNLDATAELNLYGNVFRGGWLAEDESHATIHTNEVEKPMRLEGGKLVLGNENDYFVFVPSTPEAYQEFLTHEQTKEHEQDVDDELAELLDVTEYQGEATEEGATPEDQEGEPTEMPREEPNEQGIYPMDLTVADDALVLIKVTGRGEDNLGCSGYYLTIRNKSDKPFTVTRAIDTFMVDGKPTTPVLNETLEPGQSVEVFMWWDASEVADIERLVKVEGVIEVDEVNGFEAYGTYELLVP
ncbi:MAG: hypothetical protein IJ781_04865 [Atopobiaceae bacterium]|nr:hypothetical protein [Atopobiaceae bacterium]